MTLTITDITMTSDQNPHTARLAPAASTMGSVLAARPGPGPLHRHHRVVLADIAGKATCTRPPALAAMESWRQSSA